MSKASNPAVAGHDPKPGRLSCPRRRNCSHPRHLARGRDPLTHPDDPRPPPDRPRRKHWRPRRETGSVPTALHQEAGPELPNPFCRTGSESPPLQPNLAGLLQPPAASPSRCAKPSQFPRRSQRSTSLLTQDIRTCELNRAGVRLPGGGRLVMEGSHG